MLIDPQLHGAGPILCLYLPPLTWAFLQPQTTEGQTAPASLCFRQPRGPLGHSLKLSINLRTYKTAPVLGGSPMYMAHVRYCPCARHPSAPSLVTSPGQPHRPSHSVCVSHDHSQPLYPIHLKILKHSFWTKGARWTGNESTKYNAHKNAFQKWNPKSQEPP